MSGATRPRLASQRALLGTMEIERLRYRGVTAGATAGEHQEHQAVQSAVSEFDGLKLGNEFESEANDVRRDKTKAGQSAGPSGNNGNRAPEVQGRYCRRDCGRTSGASGGAECRL